MTDESVFSGGDGTPVDPNAPKPEMPKTVQGLMEALNSRAARAYIVDPGGLNMKITFNPSGVCTIESGDTNLTYSFKSV